MDAKKIVGAFIAMVLRVTITIFVIYYLYQTAINAYNFGFRIFSDKAAALAPGRDIQVTVTESMDEKAMAKKFEEVGLVDDWKLFWAQILLSEYKDDLKPGVYTLNNSMHAEELLAAMAVDPEAEEGEDGEDSTSTDLTTTNAADEPVFNEDDVVVPEDDWYEDTMDDDGNN